MEVYRKLFSNATTACRIHVVSSTTEMECPLVSCKQGKVKGTIRRSLVRDSKDVYAYQNVPYGIPPTGKRRFMKPEPALPWEGILECTSSTNMPFQSKEMVKAMLYLSPTKRDVKSKLEMTEDCLRLSVYTTTAAKDAKLPVMIWFYGGAFQMGFAGAFDGTSLAGLHDVVVVVPNYRVGVFGFFSLGSDSQCTGNAGLLDQHLVLQWVQNNIGEFGGDKDNVTIFGESAGGCSVNHHVNSPMSKGLFHKAISHSGQSTLAKIFKRDLSRARETFFQILEITDKDEGNILERLQTMSAEDLAKADQQLAMRFMAFNPTLDHKYIVEQPSQSLRNGNFANIPYMVGCNDSEGQGMLAHFAGVPNFATGLTLEELKTFSVQFLPRMHPKAREECVEALVRFYVRGEAEDKFCYSKALGDIYGDSMFIVPALTTASAHYDSGLPVYLYYGSYQLRMNHDRSYGPKVAQKVPWCRCDHSDDICMMWGVPHNPGALFGGAKFTPEESELSLKCMKYITNFAKTGNPNKGYCVELQWPAYTTNGPYMNLDTTTKVKRDLAPDRVRFWTKTIPEIINKYNNSKSNL